MTDRNAALGIDVGGTEIKFGLIQRSGRVLAADGVETWAGAGREGIGAGVREAVAKAKALAAEEGVNLKAAGMGIPGTVSGKRGCIIEDPPQIPGLEGWEVGDFLRAETGLPCAVDNDASLAALAEARAGAGRDVPTLLVVTVGTGIGGGVVIGGRLIRGRYGTAGEIGHMGFHPEGPHCGHGGNGCLESYCSATAVLRMFRERGGDPGASVRKIVEGAARGEQPHVSVLGAAGRNLGRGLASFSNIIPPDLILIGGGLASAGDLLMRSLREGFGYQALPHVTKGVRIRRALLGNQAGMVGAAILALEEGLPL